MSSSDKNGDVKNMERKRAIARRIQQVDIVPFVLACLLIMLLAFITWEILEW